ncbi:MAG: hypothetical protein WB762_22460, partial [Candidatus Sulfotelmatobacter sp.]
ANPQDNDVIFEFGRRTRPEKLRTSGIEQRYLVRPLVASDRQLQVQTPHAATNLQWRLTSL